MDISGINRTQRRFDPETIIRAWKDDDFAHGLGHEVVGRMPANPAGSVNYGAMRNVAFGPQHTVGCNTMSSNCNTMSSSCNTMDSSCNTMASSCNTMSGSCNTMDSSCNTMSGSCNTMDSNCNTMGGDCTTTPSCHRAGIA